LRPSHRQVSIATMRRLALAAPSWLGAMTVLGLTAPAHAHVSEHAMPAGPLPVVDRAAADALLTGAWAPLLVVLVVLALGWRCRAAAPTLLVALLVLFVFATGLHSVHHLSEPPDAPRCVLESASSHLSGATDEPVVVAGPEASRMVAGLAESSGAPWGTLRTDRGRAPPLRA
jgi:hypothetical protein